MKKLLIASAVAVAALLAFSADSEAQCCGSVCLNAAQSGCPDPCDPEAGNTPLKSRRCTSVSDDPENAGCYEAAPGTVCIAGNPGPPPTGCIGVGPQYITSSTPGGDTPEGCTAASVNGCTQTGDVITEPDSEACGFCPSTCG